MNKDVDSFPVRRILLLMVLNLAVLPSPGRPADRNRVLTRAISATVSQAQPTVTVMPAASGAFLQGSEAGRAILSLGRAAYYGGVSAPGVSARKGSSSMILSTRFALQVDCGANTLSPLAEIAVSLTGLDPSYTVTMDGAKLSSAASPVTLRCGSRTEHVLEVEIPKSRPAAPIASTISFAATPKY